MNVEPYPELLNVIREFRGFLQNTPAKDLIWRRENEPPPESIDLSFIPEVGEKTVETFLDTSVCTLCDRRISYKENQFTGVAPRLPYLILIHNSFNLYPSQYYESKGQDGLFRKMITKGLGDGPENFLVREVLRCYFGKEDEGNPEFPRNCRKHIREDIEKYRLKGVLLVGQAAQIVLEASPQTLAKKMGTVFEFEGLPTAITPGPNRIEFMTLKKYPQEQIDKEKEGIMKALTLFKDKIIDK